MPVTVIGGYLGSGKTTLVNHLLRYANGVRLAIMVNDFGDMAIDAELIESQQGDVISLSGGCICCSYGDNLSLSLQKLETQSIKPDHIVIEASGVALPGAIGRSLSLQRSFNLEGVVVVADALNVMANAQEKYIGDTITRQLHDADLVVINKLDLLSKAEFDLLKPWIAGQCPDASLIEAVHGAVESSLLLNILSVHECTDSQHSLSVESSSSHAFSPHTLLQKKHDVSLYASVSINVNLAMNVNAFASRLADKRLALIRAKGFLRDKNNVLKTVQVVGRRWSVTDAPAGAQTGIVCIAKKDDLSEGKIQELLFECTVESSTNVQGPRISHESSAHVGSARDGSI